MVLPTVAQVQDTLQTSSLLSRMGINTISYKNDVVGHIIERNHDVRALIANNQLYNRAQRQGSRFVNDDYILQAFHSWRLGKGFYTGQEWLYNNFRANNTRIAAGYTHVGKISEAKRQVFGGRISLGYMGDKRGFNQNNGFSYMGDLWHKYFSKDSSLQVFTEVLWQDHRIMPRRNNYLRAFSTLFKNFSNSASAELYAGRLRRRMEDFVAADIQSITSDTSIFKLNLRYNFTDRLFVRSLNSFFTPDRGFDYRNAETGLAMRNVYYTESNFESTQELFYTGTTLQTSLRLDVRQRDRAYGIRNMLSPDDPDYLIKLARYNLELEQEKIKDIREQNITWTYLLSIAPTKKDLIRLNYSAQLFRVDTRSPLNTQDRDEILYSVETSWSRRLRPGLRSDLKVSGNLRQFVFITPEQSIENFKERILRLEPTIRWNFNNLSWLATYGLWATYQVRDFESAQDKNRSNRVHIMNHNIAYKWNKQYRLLVDMLRRENRLSLLNWKNFSESPIDTVVIYDVSIRLQRNFKPRSKHDLSVQGGYRLYSQSRKNARSLNDGSGVQKKAYVNNVILQHGPQLILQYFAGSRFRLTGDLWFQQSKVYNKFITSEESFFGSTISLEELMRVDRRFLPYFIVQAFYNFN